MPRPDAPPPASSHETDVLKLLPPGLQYVECTTGFHESGKRVHVRLEGRFLNNNANELLGCLRVGRWVWQHFIGPSLRAYCLAHSVGFVLHEVEVQTSRPGKAEKTYHSKHKGA